MAKFTITFEDSEDGGMEASIVLINFNESSVISLEENTAAQNVYFGIANWMNGVGLRVPANHIKRCTKH